MDLVIFYIGAALVYAYFYVRAPATGFLAYAKLIFFFMAIFNLMVPLVLQETILGASTVSYQLPLNTTFQGAIHEVNATITQASWSPAVTDMNWIMVVLNLLVIGISLFFIYLNLTAEVIENISSANPDSDQEGSGGR